MGRTVLISGLSAGLAAIFAAAGAAPAFAQDDPPAEPTGPAPSGEPAEPTPSPDPKFEFGKPDELEKVKDVEWSAISEAGLVLTTGNSENVTVSGGLKVARKTGYNKLAFDASVTYARSGVRVLQDLNLNGMVDSEDEIRTQSTTTAETFAGKLRYDRFLTKSNSLFVAALGSRNLPAGKESVLGGQLGYSRRLYKSKRHEAVAELGYDFARENLVIGAPASIHSARVFAGYKGELATGAALEASAEALTNLLEVKLPTMKDGRIGRDTRINTRLAASAKIGASLAIQTSLELKYDHRPGPLAIKMLAPGFVPEAAPLDTIMKASLIYTFL